MKRAAISLLLLPIVGACVQQPPPFRVDEASISRIHEALKSGRVTCRGLVDQYLRRINAYDKNGPAINALVLINPLALKQADDLDRRAAQGGFVGPLHCVPMIVKDNFETIGLQSANGSLALAGFVSSKDAFQVATIKEAGAIVLAKSNMAEWAFTPYETVSSILPGYTKNPYALDRVTAGSSGGTAAAVAASFGAVGLGQRHRQLDSRPLVASGAGRHSIDDGTDEPGRRHAAQPARGHRWTDGAHRRGCGRRVSGGRRRGSGRSGDCGGPHGRARPKTTQPRSRAMALRGARIGILRQAYERDTTDPEIVQVFMQAVEDLRRAGATSSIPRASTGSTQIRRPQGVGSCMGFKYDINRYLAAHGDACPSQARRDRQVAAAFIPPFSGGWNRPSRDAENGPETPACKAEAAYREQVRAAVAKTMDATEAGRVRLSDVEQSAATDRRSQHAARRQQPVLFADHRLSRDPGADGLHARGLAGRPYLLRSRVD